MNNILRNYSVILLTEDCPLDCKNCGRKITGSGVETPQCPTDEEVLSLFNHIFKNREDDEHTIYFTGGEPMIKWELLEKIFTKYGNHFNYNIMTSGQGLTKERIRFLSNYNVRIHLSTYGTSLLSNYARPQKSHPYSLGNFHTVKETFPTLLYYFPDTTFKVIFRPPMIPYLSSQYLEIAGLGFRSFSFVLDWGIEELTREEIGEFKEQIDLIINYQRDGWRQGILFPRIPALESMAQTIAKFRKLQSKIKIQTKLQYRDYPSSNITVLSDKVREECIKKYDNLTEEFLYCLVSEDYIGTIEQDVPKIELQQAELFHYGGTRLLGEVKELCPNVKDVHFQENVIAEVVAQINRLRN